MTNFFAFSFVQTEDGVVDAASKKAAYDLAERDTENRIWTTISLLAKLKVCVEKTLLLNPFVPNVPLRFSDVFRG